MTEENPSILHSIGKILLNHMSNEGLIHQLKGGILHKRKYFKEIKHLLWHATYTVVFSLKVIF